MFFELKTKNSQPVLYDQMALCGFCGEAISTTLHGTDGVACVQAFKPP